MSNALREYLQGRYAELQQLIAPLRAEIAEQQRRLALYEAELDEVENASEAIGLRQRVRLTEQDRNIRRGTIKDYAVQVLSDFPSGLVALDILSKINERFGTDFPRTSLSPQLSRLKEEGVVDRRGMVWYLVNNDKGPDDESGPTVGGVAERSNAPDSKSGGPGSSKNTTGPVGSNPTTSAPFHRVKEDLLAGVSLFGATTTPSFHGGKKGA